MQKIQLGFTLIELMIVIALIGIMASLAIPRYQDQIYAQKIDNAVEFSKSFKTHISDYYRQTQRFPTDNKSAGLPPPNKLISPEVKQVVVKDGALHIHLADTVNDQLNNAIISIRPVYVADSPKTPISWICGNALIPEQMQVAGKNKTSVPYTMLPIACRDLTGNTAKLQASK